MSTVQPTALSRAVRRRIPGLLYLTVIATGFFSIAYAPGRLFPGADPSVIAEAVSSQLPLLRAAIATSVVCYIAFLLLPLSLHSTLAPVGRESATLMAALVAVSVPVSLASVGQWIEILALAEGRGVFGTWPRDAIQGAITLADVRHGALQRIATVFWGLWLIPLGILAWRSGTLPRVICLCLVTGGVGYVVAIFGSWLSPAFGASPWPRWITGPATLGELSTCAWLLVRPPNRSVD